MLRLLVTSTRAGRALVVGGLLVVGACADRGQVAGPPANTGASTWAAVVVATVAAAVMLAALIVLPALRRGGSPLGSWVLGLQAGGVAVASAIIIGAAIRSEQLLHRPADAEQAASLLRLTGLDGGDSEFFTLIVLVTVIVGGLALGLLVLAARFAADTDPIERTLATGLLGLEVLGSAVCWVLVALGFRHTGFVLPALALPVLVLAAWSAWPRILPDP